MPRLNRDDWVAAALEVLLQDGPDAVAVQPVARRLNATKGSFYWHFDSRDALLRAVLERWEQTETDEPIAEIEAAGGSARDKAGALLARITASSAEHPGQFRLLAATDQPDIAATVARVTERRLDYLGRLARAGGLAQGAARRRALLAYAAYLGQAQLAQTAPGVLPQSGRARRAAVDEIIDQLFA